MDRAQLRSTGRLSAPTLVHLVHEMLDIRLSESEGATVVKHMASGENAEDGFIDINDFERAIHEKLPPMLCSGPVCRIFFALAGHMPMLFFFLPPVETGMCLGRS